MALALANKLVRGMQKFPTFKDPKGVLRYRKPDGSTPSVARSDAAVKAHAGKKMKRAEQFANEVLKDAQNSVARKNPYMGRKSFRGNQDGVAAKQKVTKKKTQTTEVKKTVKKAKQSTAKPKTAAAKKRKSRTEGNNLSRADSKRLQESQNRLVDLKEDQRLAKIRLDEAIKNDWGDGVIEVRRAQHSAAKRKTEKEQILIKSIKQGI